jgi:hypothetical protein
MARRWTKTMAIMNVADQEWTDRMIQPSGTLVMISPTLLFASSSVGR